MSRIKQQLQSVGPSLTHKDDDEVLFSFKLLHEKVSFPLSKDPKFFHHFLLRLKKLSTLGWKEIERSGRHQFGTERIPVKQIIPTITNKPAGDVTHLTVFRATGKNNAFLGVRTGNIFYILFIEARFGDVYKH